MNLVSSWENFTEFLTSNVGQISCNCITNIFEEFVFIPEKIFVSVLQNILLKKMAVNRSKGSILSAKIVKKGDSQCFRLTQSLTWVRYLHDT